MTRTILPTYTPARHRWLARLRYSPLMMCQRRGVVGYHCMRLGWTQWVWGGDPWHHTRGKPMQILGEALTDEGLRVLMRWQIEHPPVAHQQRK